MSNAATPNRWFSAWRSEPRPMPLDLADLGTAFGLDASFDQAETAAQDLPRPTAKPGWMQRLSSRARRPT